LIVGAFDLETAAGFSPRILAGRGSAAAEVGRVPPAPAKGDQNERDHEEQ
jgi:hypothetical protein